MVTRFRNWFSSSQGKITLIVTTASTLFTLLVSSAFTLYQISVSEKQLEAQYLTQDYQERLKSYRSLSLAHAELIDAIDIKETKLGQLRQQLALCKSYGCQEEKFSRLRVETESLEELEAKAASARIKFRRLWEQERVLWPSSSQSEDVVKNLASLLSFANGMASPRARYWISGVEDGRMSQDGTVQPSETPRTETGAGGVPGLANSMYDYEVFSPLDYEVFSSALRAELLATRSDPR